MNWCFGMLLWAFLGRATDFRGFVGVFLCWWCGWVFRGFLGLCVWVVGDGFGCCVWLMTWTLWLAEFALCGLA